MPLVALDSISIAFGHVPLLDSVSFQIDAGERVAVIGRNGAGKSTLLNVLAGELPPDTGVVIRQPGVRTARLVQDVPLSADRTVAQVVGEGLGVLDEHDEWQREHQADMVMSRLSLPPDAIVDTLSGGWKRRVLLAQALIGRPDLLLLDEPTNHLDIEAITWLESFLEEYRGAVVFVTHDRAFLERLGTRIAELDQSDEDVDRLQERIESPVAVVGPRGVRLVPGRIEASEERLRADEKIVGIELEEIGRLPNGGKARDQNDATTGPDLLEARALPSCANIHPSRFEQHDVGRDGLQDPLGLVDRRRQGRLPAALPDHLREGLPRLGVLGNDHDPLRHPHTHPRLRM